MALQLMEYHRRSLEMNDLEFFYLENIIFDR